MPRTSRPPEPASERKHGVWQTNLSGSASGEDFVAHDVGHRHFGGRDQVERVLIATQHLEQVFLELGQLAGAEQAGGVDQVRRVELGVAMLFGVRVEHELGKRPVQAGQAALEQREARAGDLGGGGEIELARPSPMSV
jgi:hypothetical protein